MSCFIFISLVALFSPAGLSSLVLSHACSFLHSSLFISLFLLLWPRLLIKERLCFALWFQRVCVHNGKEAWSQGGGNKDRELSLELYIRRSKKKKPTECECAEGFLSQHSLPGHISSRMPTKPQPCSFCKPACLSGY